jgi:hypothetical protein
MMLGSARLATSICSRGSVERSTDSGSERVTDEERNYG